MRFLTFSFVIFDVEKLKKRERARNLENYFYKLSANINERMPDCSILSKLFEEGNIDETSYVCVHRLAVCRSNVRNEKRSHSVWQ